MCEDRPPSNKDSSDEYSGKKRNCDLVLKGGITSGIVFPRGICEIAKKYRFRSIGGSSVGVIAAAAAAAAEYRRQKDGSAKGFDIIEGLPDELTNDGSGGITKLFSLFQPKKEVKKEFHFILNLLGTKGNPIKIVSRLIGAARKSFWPWFVGIAFLIIFSATYISVDGKNVFYCNFLEAGIIFAMFFLLTFIIRFIFKTTGTIRKNGFGFCSGLTEKPNTVENNPALTNWMADKLDDIAGKTDGFPLTFGDLREHEIELRMITTSLTHGRPFNFPVEVEDIEFYFDSELLSKYFPERIVDWMVKNPPNGKEESGNQRIHPLPQADKLPVVVAARLCISFPFLLSAVPLHAVDESMKTDDCDPEPEKCWFSDGGISSNFPIHLFDRPLPRWPTFAINFAPEHPRRKVTDQIEDQAENVQVINSIGEKPLIRFTQIRSITNFLAAILDTSLNWMDNAQMRMPGFRDRIAHVYMKGSEGGLNLKMPGRMVRNLARRGEMAGQKLVKKFENPSDSTFDLNWDCHRWIRYRRSMASLEELFCEFIESYLYENPDIENLKPYKDIIEQEDFEAPEEYQWRNGGQRDKAEGITEELVRLLREWRELAAEERVADEKPSENKKPLAPCKELDKINIFRDDKVPKPKMKYRAVPKF